MSETDEPLLPGEIRIISPKKVHRIKPGDGDYEDMRVYMKPGAYYVGGARPRLRFSKNGFEEEE